MEAFVFLLVSSGMTFAEAARVSGVSSYQAKEIVVAYTEEAVNHQDLSGVRSRPLNSWTVILLLKCHKVEVSDVLETPVYG